MSGLRILAGLSLALVCSSSALAGLDKPPPSSVGLKGANSQQIGVPNAPMAVQSRFVRVPLRAVDYTGTTLGASTFAFGVGSYPNPDGSGILTRMTAVGEAVSGSGTGIYLDTTAWGTDIGFAFQRSSTAPTFNVVIDGVAYSFNAQLTKAGIVGPTFTDDYAIGWVRGLSADKPHDVRISIPSSGTVSVDRVLNLYGLVLDERYGYRSPPATEGFTTPIDTPTTQTAVPYNTGARNELGGLYKVAYANTTAGAVVCTVRSGSATIWSKSIAAGDTAEWATGGTLPVRALAFTHACASSGVTTISYGPVK